ncbi:DUF1097 family protein [Nocardioides sp. Root151]|uniref:DUF1097 family protein n=1 Tax=Nocardioides sp. Root151 TaxID=1736475 RepID=UPI0007025509|nr:DUF1097 domain-containing protein [Nocardioides sp. Root151]KQZ72159.1 hypothetical protein ASD66_23785 [Nocardioides sp. Root151]
MTERLKATTPLALSVAVLAALWIEFGANFTFHWFTNGDLGNGLSLPDTFHMVLPAAFISWAMFFAAGADRSAFNKAAIGSVMGGVGALVLMFLLDKTKGLPDFWPIALIVGLLAFVVVLGSALGDWYFVPAIFAGFASTLFWWIATGMDGWAAGGGGGANTVASLGNPATAGTGAFGGVISTPYVWVCVDTIVSLLIGCVLGIVSVRLAALMTPAQQAKAEQGATA